MKTAFITGASSGFGLAVAEALANEGYKIIALARRAERLEALREKYGPLIHPLVVDVRDRDAIYAAVDGLPEGFRGVDLLFNNAGVGIGLDEFDKLSPDEIDLMIDTNVRGFTHVTQALLPLMRAVGGGQIFGLGSVAAHNAYFGGNVYCGTKAFVRQFSRALRNDLRGSGIRVTVLSPGLCQTEFSQVRFRGDKAAAAALYEGTKFLSAADIAAVVLAITKLPPHVNVNEIELMPVTQSWNGFFIEKTGE